MPNKFSLSSFKSEKESLQAAAEHMKTFEDNYKFTRYKGSQYGLPLNVFMTKLFQFNETAIGKEKWSDVVICAKVRKEYKRYERLMRNWDPLNYEKKLSDLRHKFNRGILIASAPCLPEKLSYRYDGSGKIICAKLSKKRVETSVGEWILKVECKYSALAYFQMDSGVFSQEEERDWFQAEDHPYVQEQLSIIRKKAEEAHKKHGRGVLRKGRKNETSISES